MSFPGRGQGRSPFTDLDRLREEVSRIVSTTLGGRWAGLGGGALRGWSQDVQVDEAADAWTVTVRLPGVAAEEVQVDLEERELRVTARHAEGDEPLRARSQFRYRLTLPSDVDIDGTDATMDHGLLVVRLPRVPRTGPRHITVRSPGRTTLVGGTAAAAGGSTAAEPAPGPAPDEAPPDEVPPGTTIDA